MQGGTTFSHGHGVGRGLRKRLVKLQVSLHKEMGIDHSSFMKMTLGELWVYLEALEEVHSGEKQ